MRILSLGALLFLACTSVAYAQFSLTGLERQLTLTLAPTYPEPEQLVQLSIQTYALDLDRSTIVWYANDAEIARGVGETKASVQAGKAGEELHILVIARDEEGITASAEAFIRPAEVDLLWEALSYVPPFYAGRALPGANSPIRAHALARFYTPNGTLIPDSDIIYTWYRGDAVALKGRGKSSAVLQGPALFNTETIRVVVESADKSFSGEAGTRIFSTDPFVLLYENHPLFGPLYHRALQGSVNTLEVEQTITAAPYFANILTPQDASLSYNWSVNGSLITPDPKEPHTLTITAQDYSGPADIELNLSSLSDVLLQAAAEVQLVFGGSASLFDNLNPFFGGVE